VPAKTEWTPTPLPRGRHNLPAADVHASQRERLLQAMLESVAERGYAATTVASLAAAARVSPNVFYQSFTDKLDCFLTMCNEQTDGLYEAAVASAGAPDWRAAVREGARN
jgi:AcrR family transcriptional regulator